MESKKILIVGGGGIGAQTSSDLIIQSLKEKYGDGIVLITPEEAEQHRLSENDFANIPKIEIAASPLVERFYLHGMPKSGNENRNERRKNNRERLKMNRKFKN